LRQAGKAGECFGRYKFSFAPELHAGDHGGQVHVAAALSSSKKSALNLAGPGKNGGSGIGNSKTAIGMAVKSDLDLRVPLRQAADYLSHFFRIGATGGIANHQPAHFLAGTLLHDLVK